MRILRRYIARQLVFGWVMVLVVLTAIFTLLLLIDEMDRVTERYTIVHALSYLLGSLPQRALDLTPVSALLGTLITLGNMARYSELVVMRSAGIAQTTLLKFLLVPVSCLVLLLYFVTEYVAAPLYLQAEMERQVTRTGKLDLLASSGLWANSGNRFIFVRKLHLGYVPQGVEVFHFDDNGELITAIRGREARVSASRKWTLRDVVQKQRDHESLRTTRSGELDIGAFWSENELPVLALSPTGMSPARLFEYVEHLEDTDQPNNRLNLVLWQKLTLPLNAAAMVFLAAPIGAGLGNLRSGSFGLQLALGAVLGVSFYMVSQVIYNAGLILGAPAPLVACVPLFLLICLTALLVHIRR